MVTKRKTKKTKKKAVKKKTVRHGKPTKRKITRKVKPRIKINDNLVIALLITVIGLGILIIANPNGISLDKINLPSMLSIILICIGFITAMNSVK